MRTSDSKPDASSAVPMAHVRILFLGRAVFDSWFVDHHVPDPLSLRPYVGSGLEKSISESRFFPLENFFSRVVENGRTGPTT